MSKAKRIDKTLDAVAARYQRTAVPWPQELCDGCTADNCDYSEYCTWEKWIDARMKAADYEAVEIPIFAKIALYRAFLEVLES